MNHLWKSLAALLLSLIPTVAKAQNSCEAASATTWECTVRCYEAQSDDSSRWRWLENTNQTLLLCSALPNDLQAHIDRACGEIYRDRIASGWQGRGYFNWPASPGTLAACKAVGNKCTRPGPVKSIWMCPASCRGSRTYPTVFNRCATSEKTAWSEGLSFYATSGAHALCASGHTLGAPESSEPFNDPPERLCKSTQKECDCAP